MSLRIHQLVVFLSVICVAPMARAESLFLGPPIVQYNVQAVKVDVKYTLTDKTNKIGQFTAFGQATSYGGVSNNITNGSYQVSVFFDLATGAAQLSDPGNYITVSGKLGGVQQDFFKSTVLKRFGSGTEDTFDVIFGNNQGKILTNGNIYSRIVGTSISAFHDPNFKYTVTGSSHNGDIIWQNALVGTSKIGTANVWTPVPQTASAGSVLILGFGAYSGVRRFLRTRRRRAAAA